MTRLPRWRKAEPLAKSYLGNTLHILGALAVGLWHAISSRRCRSLLRGCLCLLPGLGDTAVGPPAGNMTNAGMQAFILRRLRASAVFLRPFEKLTRKLLKAALQLFGTADDRAVRVQAILFVRQVAIVLPQPALDMCLKVRAHTRHTSTLLAAGHAASCRTCNSLAHNLPGCMYPRSPVSATQKLYG